MFSGHLDHIKTTATPYIIYTMATTKNKTKYFDKKQSGAEKYSQYIDKYNALQSISGDGHVINNGTTVEEVSPSTIDTKKDNINKLREDAHSLVNNLIDFLLLMR